MLGKFVWGAGWRARGANVVYVVFALMCVHLAWFDPPKGARIPGGIVCDRFVKKRKWEMYFYGVRATEWRGILLMKYSGPLSLYSAPDGVITVV